MVGSDNERAEGVIGVWWAMLLGFGLAAGLSLVGFLIAERPLSRLFGVVGLALAVGLGVTIPEAVRAQPNGLMLLIATVGALAAVIGGYWLGASLLTSVAPIPAVATLESTEAEDARVGLVAVACVEPERYRLRATLREATSLQQAADAHIPEFALPFLLGSERARYRSVGGSKARAQLRHLLDAVHERLPGERFLPPLAAWCVGEPYPDQAVAKLVEAGVRRIVVFPVSVAPSARMRQALDRLTELHPSAEGVGLIDVPYLADLAPLDEHLADGIAALVPESARANAGVALVGTGQPHEWDRVYPEGPDEETAFMQRVRLALGERGFDQERVRLVWAEWRQPDVTDGVRHLAALGCSRVVVAPACEPFATLSVKLDVAQAIRLARLDDATEVETLPSWGDDAELAAMIAESLERAVAPQAE